MTQRAFLGEFELVEVTPKGVSALAEHRDAPLPVWEGLDATLGNA